MGPDHWIAIGCASASILIQTVILVRSRLSRSALVDPQIVWFRYDAVFRWSAIGCACLPPLFPVFIVFKFPSAREAGAIWACVGFCILLTAISGCFLLDAFRFALGVAQEGLHVRCPWNGNIIIRWRNLRTIRWTKKLEVCCVESKDGKSYRFWNCLDGISEFLATSHRHYLLHAADSGRLPGYGPPKV
jgi:hypothetical protein